MNSLRSAIEDKLVILNSFPSIHRRYSVCFVQVDFLALDGKGEFACTGVWLNDLMFTEEHLKSRVRPGV